MLGPRQAALISPLPWHTFRNREPQHITALGNGVKSQPLSPQAKPLHFLTTVRRTLLKSMEASSSPSTLNPLAEPFRSARPPTSNPPPATDPAHEQLFHTLSTYPFHQDAEFQSGLSAILGHPETPTSPDEVGQNADLVLKAQCFYFSRSDSHTHTSLSPHNSITATMSF
jgi:hypothetical protein